MGAMIPAGYWELHVGTGNLNLCPRSCEMFGLSSDRAETLTETDWVGRIHPDDLQVIRQSIRASLIDQKPYAERFRTIHADGTHQIILGIGGPLSGAGESGRFAGWNVDVSGAAHLADEQAHGPDATLNLLSDLLSEPSQPVPSPDQLLRRAETILHVRKSRERLFSRAMIGEPAFELLLALYVCSADQNSASMSFLAKKAAIPYSSASRWLGYLVDKGFVSRAGSANDRRAVLVQLTVAGRAVMDEFLAV